MGASLPKSGISQLDPEKFQSQLNEFFRSQLLKLGLTEEQIEGQSKHELESSLNMVNDAIKRPDAFGVLELRFLQPPGWWSLLRHRIFITKRPSCHYY